MAQDMEGAVERSEGPSVRDAVIASVATHRESPDVTSAVNSGMAERDRETRSRSRNSEQDHYQREGSTKDHLKATIRNAVSEANLKAVQPPQTATTREAPAPTAGPPPSWSTKDKQHWDAIPEPARLAILNDHSQIRPHLERLTELDRVIGPSRGVFQRYGVKSDSEAVQRLFEWEHALRSEPRAGIVRLAQQLGVDLRELTGGYQQQASPQQHDYSPQQFESADRQVNRFMQDHPDLNEPVRRKMASLIAADPSRYMQADGMISLEKAHEAAVSRRAAPSSDKRGRSVGSDLREAFKQARRA